MIVDELMCLARNAAAAWHRDESMDNPRVLKFDAAETTLCAAIESALADAYDTGMRKGSVWGLAKVQPKPEPVGWLDAPYAVFRANPNWQWESGPTTLSASIPVFLHPAPQPEAIRIALSVAKGALGMCKPCAERDCKAEQQAWIDEALAAIERAIRKGD